MSHKHLTEEQLQLYAFGSITEEITVEHVINCAHCQMQIKAYQLLYNHIVEAEEPSLDLNVAELIPKQLPGDEREARYLYWLGGGVAAVFVVAIIICWNAIEWLFTGLTTVVIVFGLLIVAGVVIMQIMELFQTRRKILKLE